LPCNLRPTTRECVHLVMCGYFRSRDKDGGHINQSAIGKNHTIHANIMDLCFTEPELLPCYDLFCSCDLDLDLGLTFIYKLDPYSLELYRMCKYELSMLRLSKDIIGQT